MRVARLERGMGLATHFRMLCSVTADRSCRMEATWEADPSSPGDFSLLSDCRLGLRAALLGLQGPSSLLPRPVLCLPLRFSDLSLLLLW